jgi:hypothetical protein
MELGNLIFGNSRGEYPLERGVGFEEELYRLFDVIAKSQGRQSGDSYGEEYENDVFSVFPYYWGDCTCGFDNYEFTEEHSSKCFQKELEQEKLKNGWIKNNYGFLDYIGSGLKFGDNEDKAYKIEEKREKNIVKKLYEKKKGWDTKSKDWWYGFAVRCDCDYNQRYENWLKQIGYPDGHREDCLLIKPNFLYKPTGLRIKWYKYPLRDAYISEEISLEEFRKVIDHCVQSVKQNK